MRETGCRYDNTRAVSRGETFFVEGRDYWYQDEVPNMSTDCPVEWMDSEVCALGSPQTPLHFIR